MKIVAISPNQIKPGMVLAQDIYDSSTGVILLSTGYVITKKALEAIKLFSTEKEYLVYLPSIPKPEKAPAEEKTKIGVEVAPLPQKINRHTRKLYLDTFNAVKDLYESSHFFNTIDAKKANLTAENLAQEIIRDHQVLLQIAVLKAIDSYTFSHAVHVSIYASAMAKFLHFSSREIQEISLAGLLHDIGKIDISPEIVNKPGKLTAEEFETMKKHVNHGVNRLQRFRGISRNILKAIGQHHERIDGSGYPQKLKGSEIHKWARLLAIADIYDAVTTDRVYRKALLPHEGAEILANSSSQLDRHYLKIFLRNISLYPVGCKVLLNNGEEGIILKNVQDTPLRPIIQLLNKEGTKTINLANSPAIFITKIIKG